MNRHPDLLFYLKCPTCGYTEYQSHEHEKIPNADKLSNTFLYTGHGLEQQLKDEEKPTVVDIPCCSYKL
jgi:hypothetical protein